MEEDGYATLVAPESGSMDWVLGVEEFGGDASKGGEVLGSSNHDCFTIISVIKDCWAAKAFCIVSY